ncbi:MAG: glycogen synthase GlgA, partial [Roseiarcus sp.]
MSALVALSIASEIYPLVKTGGLADVAGALPAALARENVAMRTLTPGYPAILAKLDAAEPAYAYPTLFGGPARILAAKANGLELFVLDAPHLFERPGNPYLGPDGLDWSDNAQRFAALARVGADIAKGAIAGFAPKIVHAHDWQGALAPAYLHYDGGARPGTVLTIHNLAFQGHFPASAFGGLGLPAHALSIDGVEYFEGVGFLKAGLQFADRITTVSPTYAREIMTPEFGMALDGLLRARAGVLEGIVNGIDDTVWNPATDPNLAQNYSALRIDMRPRNKCALQQRFGLTASSESPLFGVISRLTSQKGLDLLLAVLSGLVARGAQLAVLGSGEKELEEGFAAAARHHPGAVGCAFAYDEALAHLMQAGSDFIVVPSRFEP